MRRRGARHAQRALLGATPNSYGPVLCNGTDTSQQAAAQLWTIDFSVQNAQLVCAVNGGQPTPLVDNVVALAVYYGVKHDFAVADYNVDTYETWTVLSASLRLSQHQRGARGHHVREPAVWPALASRPPSTVERVIQVMARGGMHT